MHIPCVQPACDPLQVELPATTSSVHTSASGNRASSSSPRHLLLLTPDLRSLPMVRIAPKHWSGCKEPPSSCSHHLPAHLRSAQILRCGENVKVSGGDKEGSSSQGCLPEVIPRCVAAGRQSPPDISLILSVRRAVCADLLGATDECPCRLRARTSRETAFRWTHRGTACACVHAIGSGVRLTAEQREGHSTISSVGHIGQVF